MNFSCKIFLAIAGICFSSAVMAQDKIFKTDGDTIFGKVVEISERHIKFKLRDNSESPYYSIRNSQVDSVVYPGGRTDVMANLFRAKQKTSHLTSKNTYSFDLLGFVHFSFTQWYERRVAKGKIGIRIPLYLSYGQDYSPGYSAVGRGIPYNYVGKGFAFATGINPKFYLNRHPVARAFVGPEADAGFTGLPNNNYTSLNYPWAYNNHGTGNVQAAGIAGLNINPVAHLNITIEGGMGYTVAFNKNFSARNPIWRVGLSIGGNF